MSSRYTDKFSIGLTGGIGSGKSTVAQYFSALGIDIIDSDLISRQLTAKNGLGTIKIAEVFGEDFLLSSGELNREKMRSLVFSNADEKARLESILHPLIRHESIIQANASTSRYIVFDMPLLIETNQMNRFDRVVAIITPLEQRIEQLLQRGLTESQIMPIIASQVGDLMRQESADDIIENNSTLTHLKTCVESLHEKYLTLSQSH